MGPKGVTGVSLGLNYSLSKLPAGRLTTYCGCPSTEDTSHTLAAHPGESPVLGCDSGGGVLCVPTLHATTVGLSHHEQHDAVAQHSHRTRGIKHRTHRPHTKSLTRRE